MRYRGAWVPMISQQNELVESFALSASFRGEPRTDTWLTYPRTRKPPRDLPGERVTPMRVNV